MTGDLVRFRKGRCLYGHDPKIVAIVLAEWHTPKNRRKRPDMMTVLTSKPETGVFDIELIEQVTTARLA